MGKYCSGCKKEEQVYSDAENLNILQTKICFVLAVLKFLNWMNFNLPMELPHVACCHHKSYIKPLYFIIDEFFNSFNQQINFFIGVKVTKRHPKQCFQT